MDGIKEFTIEIGANMEKHVLHIEHKGTPSLFWAVACIKQAMSSTYKHELPDRNTPESGIIKMVLHCNVQYHHVRITGHDIPSRDWVTAILEQAYDYFKSEISFQFAMEKNSEMAQRVMQEKEGQKIISKIFRSN